MNGIFIIKNIDGLLRIINWFLFQVQCFFGVYYLLGRFVYYCYQFGKGVGVKKVFFVIFFVGVDYKNILDVRYCFSGVVIY